MTNFLLELLDWGALDLIQKGDLIVNKTALDGEHLLEQGCLLGGHQF